MGATEDQLAEQARYGRLFVLGQQDEKVCDWEGWREDDANEQLSMSFGFDKPLRLYDPQTGRFYKATFRLQIEEIPPEPVEYCPCCSFRVESRTCANCNHVRPEVTDVRDG